MKQVAPESECKLKAHVNPPKLYYTKENPEANTGCQQAPLSTGANQIHQANSIPMYCNILIYIPNPKLDSRQPRRLVQPKGPSWPKTYTGPTCTPCALW